MSYMDAVGNTTAAFVSLALFSGYMTILQSRDILHAFPFAGLLIRAMTMGAVGRAAHDMVKHVRKEFTSNPYILKPHPETNKLSKPDYSQCNITN